MAAVAAEATEAAEVTGSYNSRQARTSLKNRPLSFQYTTNKTFNLTMIKKYNLSSMYPDR